MRGLVAAFLIASLGALMAAETAAADEDQNVQELLRMCESAADLEYGICLGVLRGVSGVMAVNCDLFRRGMVERPLAAGEFPNVSYGAMRQAFINWAQANPQSWSTRGETGVIWALELAFPCQ